MIWKQKFTLEDLNLSSKNTLVEHLGIKYSAYGDDYLEATMPVDHRTVQPMGLLHGGASVALAETLGSIASVLCVDDPSTLSIVGLEINANHLRSVREGIVTGKATPIKIGRRIHVWNIEIRNEDNKMVCTSRLTVAIVS